MEDGPHASGELSDRWAGIANQAEREWVLQGAVHRLTCCRHPRDVWVRCGLKVVGGKVGKLRVFFSYFQRDYGSFNIRIRPRQTSYLYVANRELTGYT